MFDFSVYFLVAVIIFWYGYKTETKRAYLLCLILLFVFTAFRYKYFGGTDSYIYTAYFSTSNSISDVFVGNKYGAGFALINWIVRLCSSNYYVFQVVYAALTIWLLHKVLNELDISWGEKALLLFTYLCLRFIYDEWVMLRQNVADLIIWLAMIRFLKKDTADRIKYVLPMMLWIGVAYSFHTSALVVGIVIPVILLIERIPFHLKAFGVPLATLLMYFFGKPLFAPVVNFMTVYISDRYAGYADPEALESNAIYLILRLLIFAVFCYSYQWNESNTKSVVLDIMSAMLIISGLNFQIISRFMEFFAIGLYAASGQFFYTFNANKNSKQMAEVIFFVCMIIVFLRFVGYFGQGYEPLIPYRTFFYNRG